MGYPFCINSHYLVLPELSNIFAMYRRCMGERISLKGIEELSAWRVKSERGVPLQFQSPLPKNYTDRKIGLNT